MSNITQGPNFPAAILSVSRQELDEAQMTIVEGELPEDLQGHLFFLAVAGFVDSASLPGTPIVLPASDGSPVINGDGEICRIDFHKKGQESKPGEVWLKTKIAGTPSYWADKATALKQLNYGEYKFNNYGVARISEWLGVRNVVNTAWLTMKFSGEDYRLLVTLDAGRPYEIDTESLNVVTPIGWNKEWSQQIKLPLPFGLIMSTAHPEFDFSTNEMFSVNFTQSVETLLPPDLRPEFEDVEKLWHYLKRLLTNLERFVKQVLKGIEEILMLTESVPFLGSIAQNLMIVLIQIDEIIFQPDVSVKYRGLWKDLHQILLEEIQSTKLEDLQEHLANFLQLLKLAMDFLDGVKDTDEATYLIRWDGKGDFERWKLLLPDGSPVKIKQTMHQIGVTKDYVVLMDTSLKIGIDQLVNTKNQKIDGFLRKLLDYPQSPETRLYIVPRAQLQAGKRLDGNVTEVTAIAHQVSFPQEVFHFLTDYENPDNKITIHAAHANAWDVAESVRKEDATPTKDRPYPPVGMIVGGMDINRLGRYTIDGKSGTLEESAIVSNPDYTWTIALFAHPYIQVNNTWVSPEKLENIYWNSWGVWNDLLSDYIFNLYKDYLYREESLEEIRQITKKGKPASIFRLDTKQMKIADGYQFPPGYFGNSPQFIPRANATEDETDGYLACTVLYDSGDRAENPNIWTSEIWIFDAKDLKRGGFDPVWGTEKPLCRLSHPLLKFGFTTHTTWLPKIAPRQKDLYCVPLKKDFEDVLKQQCQQIPTQQCREIADLFEKEVYPHFPNCESETGS